MPFTPFHIVSGTSLKSIFPKYFSWSTFALTNVLIDCEPLYYFFTTGALSHKFFHTIIGGSIIAIICATLGKPVCEFGLRIWNKNFKMENIKWLKTEIKISKISKLILDFQVELGTLNYSVFSNTKIKDMKWLIMKKWF